MRKYLRHGKQCFYVTSNTSVLRAAVKLSCRHQTVDVEEGELQHFAVSQAWRDKDFEIRSVRERRTRERLNRNHWSCALAVTFEVYYQLLNNHLLFYMYSKSYIISTGKCEFSHPKSSFCLHEALQLKTPPLGIIIHKYMGSLILAKNKRSAFPNKINFGGVCDILYISSWEDIIPKFLLSLWHRILKQETTETFKISCY